MKETVLQFGTGNFLRGFFDSFLDLLNKQGLYDGKAVIVSPTDSAAVEKINRQNGRYHLLVRGLEQGKPVEQMQTVTAVSRAVNPYANFDAFLALAENPDLRFVVSNTTEAGIRCDLSCALADRPAAAFPAKVTQFLYHRYQKRLPGLVFFACELIDHNADELKACVLYYAENWKLPADFIHWIQTENAFCNTLVDRIVTGYPQQQADQIFQTIGEKDELLDTAEPFHLWVIEGNYEQELPFQKAGLHVVWTTNCAPYKKRKVRVLNGCHTSLVFPSLLCGVETVADSLNDPQLRSFLDACLNGCILPALGNSEEDRRFAEDTLQRFANPFIRHLWHSIALNSISKMNARVLPTLADLVKTRDEMPRPLLFSLACLIVYYQDNDCTDEPEKIARIKSSDIPAILCDPALWNMDLSSYTNFITDCTRRIRKDGVREAMKWVLS